MFIERNKIRLAIREMSTIEDLQQLIKLCFAEHTEEEDREFILECLSEIEYRKKNSKLNEEAQWKNVK